MERPEKLEIPTRKQFLDSKEEAKRKKIEEKKENLLNSIAHTIARGRCYLPNVTRDQEVLDHVVKVMNSRGWSVDVRVKERTHVNSVNNKQVTPYEYVTLYFGDLEEQ